MNNVDFPDPSKSWTLIAGPCSAESEEQLLETAQGLSHLPLSLFRAGIWKPRTLPGGFEGVGEKAIEWMHKVRAQYGFPIATEICTLQQAQIALDAEFDAVWIGARTTSNPYVVQSIAECIASHNRDTAVYIKNPLSLDVSLWLGAITRMEQAGISNVSAVFRGCTPYYASSYYRNYPYWRMVDELRTLRPNLSILCDPSHIAGKDERVKPVCLAAIQLGLQGLMVEVHHNPAVALTDAAQQITPEHFSSILLSLNRLKSHYQQNQGDEKLAMYRRMLEDIDHTLLEQLAVRMQVVRDIAQHKKKHGIDLYQNNQYLSKQKASVKEATQAGLSSDFIVEAYKLIHQESLKIQELE